MIEIKNIESLTFDETQMHLKVDGKMFDFDIKDVSSKLANSTEMERTIFKVSPSGYGLHWPLIDEDLSVSELIAKHQNLSVGSQDL